VIRLRRGDSCHVLLAEDDPQDVLLTREGLAESKFLHRLSVVPDGETALAFLRRESPFENVDRPDLMLLDLRLPRLDGREVLARIRADGALRDLPVVVLTSTRYEEVYLRDQRLGADAFVTKPVGLRSFVEVVRQIDEFFLTIVRCEHDESEVSAP
jgi:CheY-like chemotaxis protein